MKHLALVLLILLFSLLAISSVFAQEENVCVNPHVYTDEAGQTVTTCDNSFTYTNESPNQPDFVTVSGFLLIIGAVYWFVVEYLKHGWRSALAGLQGLSVEDVKRTSFYRISIPLALLVVSVLGMFVNLDFLRELRDAAGLENFDSVAQVLLSFAPAAVATFLDALRSR